MATLSEGQTMISHGQFETLVRKANSATDLIRCPPGLTILVSRAEYDKLRLVSKQYDNLRQNLLRGGVDENVILILSSDDADIQASHAATEPAINATTVLPDGPQPFGRASGLRNTMRPPPGLTGSNALDGGCGGQDDQNGYDSYRYHRRKTSSAGFHRPSFAHSAGSNSWDDTGGLGDDLAVAVDGMDDGELHDVHGQDQLTPPRSVSSAGFHQGASGAAGVRPSRHGPDRECMRTIQLVSIPESASHGDVVAVVRGGVLLEIYIRPHDRSAMVSFLREADAKAYFEYARKRDIYIKNKRVEVRWSDRQFVLSAIVGSRVQAGATRNLVVRRCSPRITEEQIRSDLDHIHDLFVISVKFAGGSCYISTNSACTASYARSCLMSRSMYKGSKIDWVPDECAQPLEKTEPFAKRSREPVRAKKPPVFVVPNRFQLLNLVDEGDANGNSVEDESDSDSGGAKANGS